MDEYASLSHTKWECKYHIVFIPKCRRKVLYKTLRPHLAEVFRDLAQQRESKIEEGHLMSDHVHILISIPPKYAVSQVVGYIKGRVPRPSILSVEGWETPRLRHPDHPFPVPRPGALGLVFAGLGHPEFEEILPNPTVRGLETPVSGRSIPFVIRN